MRDRLKLDGEVVFTTYDQMNQRGGADTPRTQFMRAFVPGSVLILDEAHNADAP